MKFEILFIIVGFILNTFLFTLSKLSFLYLLHLYERESKEIWIASMIIVLALPEVIALVKLLWCTPFLVSGKIYDWPSLPSFLAGIVCSIMEGISLTFFLMKIGPKLHPVIFIPLLGSVLCMRTVSLYFKQGLRIFDHKDIVFNFKHVRNLLYAAIGVLCIFLVIGTSFVTGFSQILSVSESLILSTSLLALSFTWCPGVAIYTIQSRDAFVNGRQNASIVYSILKLTVFFLVAVTITYIARQDSFGESFHSLINGFNNIYSSNALIGAILVHSASGILSHAFTYVSARICLTRSGIYLPTILVTPVIITLICYDNFYGSLHIVNMTALSKFTMASWFCFAMAVLIWFLPLLIMGLSHTRVPNCILKTSEDNFISYSYSNVFLEHYLHLNYKPDGLITKYDKTNELLSEVDKVSKVFMCTTMYRESELEMERLLKSIQRLSLSEKLTHIYMESHVILDNGCTGSKIGEFALQLLALLQNKLNVARTQVYANRMPYGLQLQWILKGGIPFFLHLKDTQKVKPKKRWSQVLYMNYILSFRVKRAYSWIKRKLNLCKIQSEPFNARYFVAEDKFDGLDSLDSKTKLPIIQYSSSLISVDSDFGSYTGDESFRSDDSEFNLSRSQCSTPRLYHHQNRLNVPKVNGKSAMCNHAAVNSSFVCDFDDSGASFSAPSTISEIVQNDVCIQIKPPTVLKALNTISGNLVSEIRVNIDSTFIPKVEDYDDRSYILSTDADMKFEEDAVLDLVDACNGDKRIGAACGRTHPVGEKHHPIVWFQMFEYAKDFWMIKSAQNIIGSVMCCPGCFSLYRITAIAQVLDEYSGESVYSSDVFIKDTGEDRWMCTLMMMRGWKLKYCTYAFNTTFCPSTMDEFLKQRRRWMLSDLANTFLVMKHLFKLVRHNACFTVVYIMYIFQLFLIVIITPGSTIIMITAGLDMVFHISFMVPTIIIGMVLLLYMAVCIFAPSKIQTNVTIVLIWIFGIAISSVFIGGAVYIFNDIISDLQTDSLQFQEHYLLILLTSSVFYAAIVHPHETWILLLGIFYMFMFPAMHILIPVYAISNIVDQSWGTREGAKATIPKIVCFPRIRNRRKSRRKKMKNKFCSNLDSSINSVTLSDKSEDEIEYKFWKYVRDYIIGSEVRIGAPKPKMAENLRQLRVKCLFFFLTCNTLWVTILSYLFSHIKTDESKLNLFASVTGSIYGISFMIQLIGMTIHRIQDTIERFIRKTNLESKHPEWIIAKERNTNGMTYEENIMKEKQRKKAKTDKE